MEKVLGWWMVRRWFVIVIERISGGWMLRQNGRNVVERLGRWKGEWLVSGVRPEVIQFEVFSVVETRIKHWIQSPSHQISIIFKLFDVTIVVGSVAYGWQLVVVVGRESVVLAIVIHLHCSTIRKNDIAFGGLFWFICKRDICRILY